VHTSRHGSLVDSGQGAATAVTCLTGLFIAADTAGLCCARVDSKNLARCERRRLRRHGERGV